MPLFSNEPEELDTSRSTDESDDWPDNDDVMTEIKKYVSLNMYGGYYVGN